MLGASLFTGIGLGLLGALPAAWWWSRRTERRVRALERRALAAERLAELGTMTGGLAHEIKNPLSTIGLNVQLIQEDLADLEPHLDADGDAEPRESLARTRRRVDGLHRETDRLRHILEDFLRFAGRVELDLQPTDLNALCGELIDFFQPQADEARVRLRADLMPGPLTVPADAGLLKQALLNLLINACQAMVEAREQSLPHGGANELILRTSPAGEPKQERVAVHVTDTGPGIEPEAVKRIFEPYFSTKRGGTGLGLPTTRRLVEEHGGTLTVHSEPGRGTDFVLTLPRA
jgi:signal transduction histidine kinase